jgi:hypothetical protein
MLVISIQNALKLWVSYGFIYVYNASIPEFCQVNTHWKVADFPTVNGIEWILYPMKIPCMFVPKKGVHHGITPERLISQ